MTTKQYSREECEALANMVKAQPPAAPAQTMTHVQALHDKQDVSAGLAKTQRVLAHVQQERDQARAELDEAKSVIVAEATKVAQARADLQTAVDYISELEEFKAEAVKTSERQLVAFQTERGVAMEKESEIRKLRAQAEATSYVVTDLLANLKAMVAAANRADVKMRDQDTYAALPEARAAIARAEKGGQP